MARFRLEALRASPEASRILLNRGDLPDESARIIQSDLAGTLDALARHGSAGFYGGKVGAQLVKGVRDAGGIWTRRDLDEYRVIEREPVTGEYRGIRITTAAPPSSGGVVLLTMLNILSGYDLDKLDRMTRTHVLVEAMRRAYRDRAEYLGDPDFTDMPLDLLQSPDYAAGLRAGIRMDRATPSAALPGVASLAPTGSDTTHFSILDRDGNRVAATLSINYPFGGCFIPPGTGVLLNDEMDDFSIKPGVANVYGLVGAEANAIAPGKRPLSSMTPTFLDSDRGVAILGTPGGSRIITMVLQGLLAYAEGAPVDEWVTRPRIHHQYLPDVIQYEPGALSEIEVAALQQLGHKVERQQSPWGNMQAVLWDSNTDNVTAASDPRGGGESVVQR
jgi:gamma-glutamyltranspeptidase/glutathione hydrolase